MSWELRNCQAALLDEIACPEATRNDVAKTYALALRSSERPAVDWRLVNAAIIARWSLSALEWIKERAWSGECFKGVLDR